MRHTSSMRRFEVLWHPANMAWCAQGSSEAAQQDRVLLSAADSLERLVREVRRGAAALQACELRCEQAVRAPAPRSLAPRHCPCSRARTSSRSLLARPRRARLECGAVVWVSEGQGSMSAIYR